MKFIGKKNKKPEPQSDDSNDIEIIEDFGFNTNEDLPPLSTSDISHVGQPVTISMPEAIMPIEPYIEDPEEIRQYAEPAEEVYPEQEEYYPEDQIQQEQEVPVDAEAHIEDDGTVYENTEDSEQTNATPDLTQYPDDTHFTEEQERAIQMVAGSASQNAGSPLTGDGTALEFGENSGFDHLAPPKKSAGKIFLKALLITALVGVLGLGGWYYWWTQFASFDYELIPVVILEGQSITADVFVPESEAERGIVAVFSDPLFSPVPGPGTVPIVLELGLRSVEADASIFVLTPIAEKIHEYKTEAPELTPADLITNSQIARNIPYEIGFVQNPLPLSEYEVGEYTLQLSLNGIPFEVPLVIRDTTAPTATPVYVTAQIGDEVAPDAFLANISDHSEIGSIVFSGENDGFPVIQAYQDQIIEVTISDIYGNSEVFGSTLSVIRNQSPPVFLNVPLTIESMINSPIAYPADVIATDDFGREIDFAIDDSDADTAVAGEYTVTYIAEDFSGLNTEIDVTLFIINIDPEEVNNWVDDKLSSILSDSMTQEESVRAIWNCVRSTIRYSATVRDSSWTGSVYTAAHYAINNTTGAHYHFYALSEIMLTRAGIENMRIERSEDVGVPHFWNIVYYEGEGWYHYDSASTSDWLSITPIQHKFNDAQAAEIAALMEVHNAFRKKGFYDYDAEKYPDIVQGRQNEDTSGNDTADTAGGDDPEP